MYGAGIERLLEALPRLSELEDGSAIRRLLSAAWLELAERRELGSDGQPSVETAAMLRRLGLALQVHTFVAPDIDDDALRACAFVAAEALDIANSFAVTPTIASDRIIVGLLYLIAGYDANAAVAVRGAEPEVRLHLGERYALSMILAWLAGTRLPTPPRTEPFELLHDQVRDLLWRRLAEGVAAHVRWLRDPGVPDVEESPISLILEMVEPNDTDLLTVGHADIGHLAALLDRACLASRSRALRTVPIPPESGNGFLEFLRLRCPRQPLLWPAAASFAASALPGPSASAVVAVPTGAGKSAVADLAIQHAATTGWVLYLAPTNALVSQIRRQLRADHPGLVIREFVGGAEYTTLDGEILVHFRPGQVFVMTPEKCSLALRQSPEAFAGMSCCILDEAHLLGDQRGRGQLTELVLTELLTRSNARILLMSALISNPEALAEWLEDVHGEHTVVVREQWRPTRTLRAVVGVEDQAARRPAAAAARRLATMNVRRRNVAFKTPLAALAGLHGPWSTNREDDYALMRIAAEVSMNVTRPRGGGDIRIDSRSVTVRTIVEALAQLLGERGQKVMAFLPRSKHDSFAAALSMSGFGVVELPVEVDALLVLATAELGVPSRLAETLAKGIGVHTSALIAEERRASEISFESGDVSVLFATGTLAQGLNLPATAVIIGGTEIGYDPDQSLGERRGRARLQLLNAIGRAGRARVAARSLALVVPTRLQVFDDATPASRVLSRAEFLAEEDASTIMLSALRPLFQRLDDAAITVDQINESDQLALSYLAPAQADPEFSKQLIGRTWAAYQLRMRENAARISATLGGLITQATDVDQAPTWAAEAARRAAVALPVAARLAAFVVTSQPRAETIAAWAETLVDALAAFSPSVLNLALDRDAFSSTVLDRLWDTDPDAHDSGIAALRHSLEAWLACSPMSDVGGAIHATTPITNSGRGQNDAIPRTIRVIENGISFGITQLAGALAAVVELAIESEQLVEPSRDSRSALELFPVALRYGATDEALAYLRAGVRPRAVAGVLAANGPAAPEGLDPEGIQDWAARRLINLDDLIEGLTLTEADERTLRAFEVTRESR